MEKILSLRIISDNYWGQERGSCFATSAVQWAGQASSKRTRLSGENKWDQMGSQFSKFDRVF